VDGRSIDYYGRRMFGDETGDNGYLLAWPQIAKEGGEIVPIETAVGRMSGINLNYRDRIL
jgi:hypothetical protein